MSPLDRELEQALAKRAGDVNPPGDLYAGVERRATRLRRQRAGTVAGAALSVLAIAVAVPALNRGSAPPPVTTPGPTPSPSAAVTTAPPDAPSPTPTSTPSASSSPATVTNRVPVYFAADNRNHRGLRLYREFHRLPGEPLRAAVEAMLRGQPLDADYSSLWPEGVKLRSVTVAGDLATVDVDGAVHRANVGSEAAERAIQQLVYTVTAADNSVRRVRLYVDGKPVQELWGHVDASKPFTRAPEVDVLGPVWLLEPEQYAQVGRTFRISGIAIAYEATVAWRVRVVATGEEVAEGVTMTTDGAKRAPWSDEVKIPARVPVGTQLEIIASETSGEEGFVTSNDSKVVVLR